MDPNAALDALRRMTAAACGADDDADPIEANAALTDIAEQFDALDNWLRIGGSLPAAWSPEAARPPLALTNVTVHIARHALWEFGLTKAEQELAARPSGFIGALFGVCAVADDTNLRRLALVFPEVASAVFIAKTWPRGMRALVDIAMGGSGDVQ